MSSTESKGRGASPINPPHFIWEAGYWRDPVQVSGGVVWLVVGLIVGAILW